MQRPGDRHPRDVVAHASERPIGVVIAPIDDDAAACPEVPGSDDCPMTCPRDRGDVETDSAGVFEANIEALAEAGITRGCNPPLNDRFCPGDAVTRGQMAAFLVRALGL